MQICTIIIIILVIIAVIIILLPEKMQREPFIVPQPENYPNIGGLQSIIPAGSAGAADSAGPIGFAEAAGTVGSLEPEPYTRSDTYGSFGSFQSSYSKNLD